MMWHMSVTHHHYQIQQDYDKCHQSEVLLYMSSFDWIKREHTRGCHLVLYDRANTFMKVSLHSCLLVEPTQPFKRMFHEPFWMNGCTPLDWTIASLLKGCMNGCKPMERCLFIYEKVRPLLSDLSWLWNGGKGLAIRDNKNQEKLHQVGEDLRECRVLDYLRKSRRRDLGVSISNWRAREVSELIFGVAASSWFQGYPSHVIMVLFSFQVLA